MAKQPKKMNESTIPDTYPAPGVLLEHSGLLIRDSFPVKLALTESNSGGRLIARGEFGRAGVATENKRVYPKPIWEREFRRLEKMIENRQVYGEADHPCLTSDDFRVFTATGWKPFREVKVGDKVWSRKNGKVILSKVDGITDQPYEGKAYHVWNRGGIDSTFTPDHRFLLVKRPDTGNTQEEMVTIAEIAANPSKYAHSAIPKFATEWFAETHQTVTIPAFTENTTAMGGKFKNDVTKDLVLDAKLFAAFVGIYMAEGGVSSDKVDNYGIMIYQKNEWSRKFIYEEVLSKFPKGLEWHEETNGYFLSDARLYTYLKALGDVYTKRLPEEAKRLDSDCLKELVFWFAIGDGRIVDTAKGHSRDNETTSYKELIAESVRTEGIPTNSRMDVFSVSKQLVQDLHECVIKTGGSGTLSEITTDKDYEYAGRTIKAENKVPLHQLHISNSSYIWMDPRSIKIEETAHKGNIYCLTTTHGNFYMEQNGKSFWTGNSDGRTSLRRVSHVITGLSLGEDGIVIGEAEILDTESGKAIKALLEAGCQVGVSSRGYGSTKPNELGEEVVQEDYKLVTFDFVAEPADTKAIPKIFSESNEHKAEVPMVPQEKLAEQRTHLRKVFAEEMVNTIARVKSEVRKSVMEELSNDPEVAGAKTVLESITALLQPYMLSEETMEVVAIKDAEIAQLQAELTASKSMIESLETDLADLSETAREVGYKFFVEQQLEGNPDAKSIRKLLGDVKSYNSGSEIAAKIEALQDELATRRAESAEKAEKARAQLEATEAVAQKRIDEAVAAAKTDAAKAKKEAKALQETLEKALIGQKELALQVYSEQRLVNFPKAGKARSILESAHPTTKAEVDQILESISHEPMRDTDLMESARARVRLRTNGGREPSALDEEKQSPSAARKIMSLNEEESDFNGIGASLNDLKRMSGI